MGETVMKYMIASDIHGSAWFCEKMLEAFEKEQAEHLLVPGDLLYHGSRNDLPLEYRLKEAAAMLNSCKESFSIPVRCLLRRKGILPLMAFWSKGCS